MQLLALNFLPFNDHPQLFLPIMHVILYIYTPHISTRYYYPNTYLAELSTQVGTKGRHVMILWFIYSKLPCVFFPSPLFLTLGPPLVLHGSPQHSCRHLFFL